MVVDNVDVGVVEIDVDNSFVLGRWVEHEEF